MTDSIKRMERHPSEWEKILIIHISINDSYPEHKNDSSYSRKKRHITYERTMDKRLRQALHKRLLK